MNDKMAKACVFGGLVLGAYGVYVGGSVAAGEGMPDGMVFGAVVGAVVGIGGYVVGAITAPKA